MGDWAVSHWAKETTVTVETDSQTIVRGREKSSFYKVDDVDLGAFGLDVPIEVSTAFNIQDFNIASQFDLPFLISLPAGHVAQFLNRIIGLDSIDLALHEVGDRKRKAKREIEYLEEKGIELSEALSKQPDLPALESLVTMYEGLEGSVEALEAQQKRLTALVVEGKRQDVSLPTSQEVSDWLVVYNEYNLHINKVDRLSKLVDKMLEEGRLLRKNERELSELEATVKVCETCGSIL